MRIRDEREVQYLICMTEFYFVPTFFLCKAIPKYSELLFSDNKKSYMNCPYYFFSYKRHNLYIAINSLPVNITNHDVR